MCSRIEPVTHSRFGDQVSRPGRVRLQLPAQLRHVDAEVVGLLTVLRAPHLLEQLLLRHQPARMAYQDLQQVPLGRGEPYLAGPGGGPPGRQVHRERLGPHHRRVLHRPGPAYRRPHPGQQLVHPEGLGHVVVGARVQRLHLVRPVVPGGQHDHRRPAPAAQPPDHVHPVHVRQAQVEDDHVGLVARGRVQRRPAVRRGVHVVPADPQVDPQGPDDPRLIVHHQHPCHASPPATGNDTTMVNPPPGVSRGVSVPPIASVNPRPPASPSPTPPAARSPSRWNGAKIRSRSAAGTPGPLSNTRSSTRPPTRPADTRTGEPWPYRSALPTRFATTRSSRPGSASTGGSVSGTSSSAIPSSPTSAAGTTSSSPTGRSAGRTELVWILLMSSRLSTSAVRWSA